MARFFCAVIIFFDLFLSFSALPVNIGDSASYNLSNFSARSSWFIESAQAKISLINEIKTKKAYLLAISYDFLITLYGRVEGTVNIPVPSSMFSEGFLEDLEENGTVKMGDFKVDYLGISEAHDGTGNLYKPCISMRIYDIEPAIKHLGLNNKFKDLEFKIKAHPSVPLLGAVELDISGNTQGFDFTVGFDYMAGFDFVNP